ncbi:general stress protein 69 [mine drainage metagenome]|uniref:General stress protein 69 n=1 Tax=mine drainage metagenome TaxID=410659 RepID=A0A1J5RSX2_9ZZZZ
MNYRRLGRTGLKVSELCLGTMQFGWTTDEANSIAVMDAFVAAGGTFIDTADIYTMWGPRGLAAAGESEEIIGRWMKLRGNRDRIVLATKVRGKMWEGPDGEGLSRARVIRCCEDSLRRLQTDHIDLYQCHWADLETPIDETLSALDDLVRAGKVRYIGASNYPAWRLMEALWQSDRHGRASFVSYQPQYSLMERAGFEIEAMPLCRHHGLGVMPYSPLACGFLTGKYRRGVDVKSIRAQEVRDLYANDRGFAIVDGLERIATAHGKTVAQTAFAWLLTNPVVTSPIVGANTAAQLQESLGAVGYRLSPQEMESLNTLSSYPKNWRPIWD